MNFGHGELRAVRLTEREVGAAARVLDRFQRVGAHRLRRGGDDALRVLRRGIVVSTIARATTRMIVFSIEFSLSSPAEAKGEGGRTLRCRLQELIDDRQELLGLLVAGVMSEPRHRDDANPRQRLLQLVLRRRAGRWCCGRR